MASSKLVKQASRFAISGLLATTLHVLIAVSVIRLFALQAPLANGIAFIVATVFSYTANTLWSFSSPLRGRNLLRFICVSCIGLILAVGISTLAECVGLHYLAGIGLVAVIIPPVTFLLHRFWTYR